jgi:hypothetical protein
MICNVATHELTIPGCYTHFDNGSLLSVGDARRKTGEQWTEKCHLSTSTWAVEWVDLQIQVAMSGYYFRAAKWRTVMETPERPQRVVTLANDLNAEHRLLMWNKDLSWFLCDYKYLAISFALTNTTASKMTAKSGALHCIILLLHSTAYDAQFISVLKILLSLHEKIFSEQNYNVNIVCPAERGTRSENHQLSL